MFLEFRTQNVAMLCKAFFKNSFITKTISYDFKSVSNLRMVSRRGAKVWFCDGCAFKIKLVLILVMKDFKSDRNQCWTLL